jgi:hypothetical protein
LLLRLQNVVPGRIVEHSRPRLCFSDNRGFWD